MFQVVRTLSPAKGQGYQLTPSLIQGLIGMLSIKPQQDSNLQIRRENAATLALTVLDDLFESARRSSQLFVGSDQTVKNLVLATFNLLPNEKNVEKAVRVLDHIRGVVPGVVENKYWVDGVGKLEEGKLKEDFVSLLRAKEVCFC